MYVVAVSFEIEARHWDMFLREVQDNAALSLKNEDGCLRFDVCTDAAAQEVFLYEIYTDQSAFERHKLMPHYLAFTQAVSPWVASKTARHYSLMKGV